MRLFVCGSGKAAEAIAESNSTSSWFIAQDVNDQDLWPCVPDLIVSVGYLRIIKPETLKVAPAINCHYSLLPRHRGRSPVPWAIVDGDAMTGVTWHWIDEGIDTGPILLQAACQIEADETQATLFGKLHDLAIETWPAALGLARQRFPGWQQRGTANHHKAGPPHGGVIDPVWSVWEVERFIRAMTYPPLPYASCNGWQVRNMKEYHDAIKAPIYRA